MLHGTRVASNIGKIMEEIHHAIDENIAAEK
jgi:hypothetical protein